MSSRVVLLRGELRLGIPGAPPAETRTHTAGGSIGIMSGETWLRGFERQLALDGRSLAVALLIWRMASRSCPSRMPSPTSRVANSLTQRARMSRMTSKTPPIEMKAMSITFEFPSDRWGRAS
eukprot:524299-Rhodomonas_salina.1